MNDNIADGKDGCDYALALKLLLLYICLSYVRVHTFWCCQCTVSFQWIVFLLLLFSFFFLFQFLCCYLYLIVLGVLLNYLLHISDSHHVASFCLSKPSGNVFFFLIFLFSFNSCLFGILYRSCYCWCSYYCLLLLL